jgi:hypothetical protein
MSRFNYSTERNKSIFVSASINIPAFKLSSSYISKLGQRQHSFTQWEMGFYKSIKKAGFKITSGKQWQIIKELVEKYKPDTVSKYKHEG